MRLRVSLAIVLFALVALGQAAPATAAYDPIAGGSSELALAPGLLARLRHDGVRLSARAPAQLRGGKVSFPAASGKIDPVAGRGAIDHEGALVFSAGRRRLPMKALQLKTTRARSPLAAKFGGGKLKLAESSRLTTERAGFGFVASVTAIRLSAKVAERLDKKLRLHGTFVAGMPFGRARTVAQPQTAAILPRGRASLELAPGFAAKLQSLFVAVNPVFPAEHPGPFTFPITGRQIAPEGSSGVVRTAGSLELLQLGGGQVFWADPYADLGARLVSAEADLEPSPKFPGKLGRVPLFDAAPGTLASEPRSRTVSISGIALALQGSTAEALNQSFAEGKKVFEAGEAVGSLSFTVQTQ